MLTVKKYHVMMYLCFKHATKSKGGENMIRSNVLKAKIIEKNLTQEDVANKLGIDRSSFNLKLNGKREFLMSEARILVELLDIDIIQFYSIFFNKDVA